MCGAGGGRSVQLERLCEAFPAGDAPVPLVEDDERAGDLGGVDHDRAALVVVEGRAGDAGGEILFAEGRGAGGPAPGVDQGEVLAGGELLHGRERRRGVGDGLVKAVAEFLGGSAGPARRAREVELGAHRGDGLVAPDEDALAVAADLLPGLFTLGCGGGLDVVGAGAADASLDSDQAQQGAERLAELSAVLAVGHGSSRSRASWRAASRSSIRSRSTLCPPRASIAVSPRA